MSQKTIHYMKRMTLLFLIALVSMGLQACGEGTVDITEAKYEPKIVVDGYIFPGQVPQDIRITRNVPLDKDIDVSSIFLRNADVKITDMQTGTAYALTFNEQTGSFGYAGNDWTVEHGRMYRIEVSAEVDGRQLKTSAVTTTPASALTADIHDLGDVRYRPVNASGEVQKLNISFRPASGVSFYAISVEAQDPQLAKFIYDNAYMELDSSDVDDELDRYTREYSWMQNINPGAQSLNVDIEWHQIWFYGRYKVIIYGGDKNFKDFLLSHKNVQEMDGNFHEPAMHLEGDGIGVFGSAVADTVYFNVIK